MRAHRPGPARRSRFIAAAAAVVGLAGFLHARPAAATPGFPSAISEHLGLSYEPPCSICHEGGRIGRTVTTPFGRAMLDRGLGPNDDASLTAALDALAADGADSDNDGTPDVDELAAGSDPNVVGGDSLLGPSPAYGCGAQIAPGATPELASALIGASLLASAFLGRRRVRRRPR